MRFPFLKKNRPKTPTFSLFKPTTCPFFTPPSSKQTPTTHQNVQSSTISTRLFNFSYFFSIFPLLFQPKSNLVHFVALREWATYQTNKNSIFFALFQKKSLCPPPSRPIQQIESMSKKRFRKFLLPFFTSFVINLI